MASLQLNAQPRTITGRKVRQLRREGLVPVVVYGNKVAATNLQMDARSLVRVLQGGGTSQLMEVNVDGGAKHNVLLKELHLHPVTHEPLHVDFYAVNMAEKQHVRVPLISVGEPESLASGLMVLQNIDHVDIEALPADIPAHVEVDITALSLERPITVADLPAIAGVLYMMPEEEAVFTMLVTREEVEEEAAEEGEEMAEPEVVAKGKAADEDEDED